MASPVNLTVLRRAFVDVCRGYSVGKYQGKDLYVRHLSHFSHLQYDSLQLTFEEYAISQGALSEEKQLEKIRAKGLWTEAKERDIARQRDTIIRFDEARKTVVLPSMQENYDRQIKEEREKLGKLLQERANLLGLTAELYAQRRLNDHYILTNVFADEALTQQIYTSESFDDLGDSEVEALLASYHTAIDPCEDANLRRLAVQSFFTDYYSLCADNSYSFYGKPVYQLTYYQVRLCNVAKYFRIILEQVNVGNLDISIRNDPDAIERRFLSQRNMEEMNREGKVPAGLTNQDIKDLSLEKKMTKLPSDRELSGAELVKYLQNQHRGG